MSGFVGDPSVVPDSEAISEWMFKACFACEVLIFSLFPRAIDMFRFADTRSTSKHPSRMKGFVTGINGMGGHHVR